MRIKWGNKESINSKWNGKKNKGNLLEGKRKNNKNKKRQWEGMGRKVTML